MQPWMTVSMGTIASRKTRKEVKFHVHVTSVSRDQQGLESEAVIESPSQHLEWVELSRTRQNATATCSWWWRYRQILAFTRGTITLSTEKEKERKREWTPCPSVGVMIISPLSPFPIWSTVKHSVPKLATWYQSSLSVILASVFSTVKNGFQSESEETNNGFPRASRETKLLPKPYSKIFFYSITKWKVPKMLKRAPKMYWFHQGTWQTLSWYSCVSA